MHDSAVIAVRTSNFHPTEHVRRRRCIFPRQGAGQQDEARRVSPPPVERRRDDFRSTGLQLKCVSAYLRAYKIVYSRGGVSRHILLYNALVLYPYGLPRRIGTRAL